MKIKMSNKAKKQFNRLNEPELSRIAEAIEKLKSEPPEGDIIKLTDEINKYRMRTGDYRIIYEKKTNDIILIQRIGRRGQAYKE